MRTQAEQGQSTQHTQDDGEVDEEVFGDERDDIQVTHGLHKPNADTGRGIFSIKLLLTQVNATGILIKKKTREKHTTHIVADIHSHSLPGNPGIGKYKRFNQQPYGGEELIQQYP